MLESQQYHFKLILGKTEVDIQVFILKLVYYCEYGMQHSKLGFPIAIRPQLRAIVMSLLVSQLRASKIHLRCVGNPTLKYVLCPFKNIPEG